MKKAGPSENGGGPKQPAEAAEQQAGDTAAQAQPAVDGGAGARAGAGAATEPSPGPPASSGKVSGPGGS